MTKVLVEMSWCLVKDTAPNYYFCTLRIYMHIHMLIYIYVK